MWEVAAGKEILRFETPEDAAAVLAFSPDGRKLVSGRINGKLDFWDLVPKEWKVETARKLDAKDLEKRWVALAGEDPIAAYEAIWDLSAVGDKAVDLLKERIRPVEAGGEKVRKLIADLENPDVEVREAADKELAKLGSQAEPDLRRAIEGKPSEELRRRAETLLQSLDQPRPTPAVLRQSRAVHVLERIDTESARDLLRTLAKGTPTAGLTQDAKRSLKRLDLRPNSDDP